MSVKRIRNKITAVNKKNSQLIRVAIFRSNRFISAQAIDDNKKVTLFSLTSKIVKEKITPTEKAKITGEKFGEMLKSKKIDTIVFDRNIYKYHGQIKNLADGIRSAGIKF